MTNPPIRKATQQDFVQVKLRLPPGLHADISSAAELHGHSLNAELLSRLQKTPIEDLTRKIDRLEGMLRQVLDRT